MILNLTHKIEERTVIEFFDRVDIVSNPCEVPLGIDTVVIDTETSVRFLTLVLEQNDGAKLYAWVDNRFFDFQSSDMLCHQQEALESKNYWVVKDINKLKIKYNTVFKNSFFDTYPTMLQVESTSLCNAKCIMCSHYYKDIKEGEHLSFETSEVLSEVLPYVETVMLHGIGEPFLNPDIIKWLDFYKSYDVHLSTFTNMSILTPALLEAIGRSFSALHISCDGCTEKTFEHIRGNLKYATFVKNIKKLRETYPNLKLHMHTVAMRQNLHELVGFVSFANELGFSSLTFSNLTINPLIRNDGDSLRCFPTMAKRAFAQVENEATKTGLKVTFPMEYLKYPDDDALYRAEQEKYDSQVLFKDNSEVLSRAAKQNNADLYATEELRVTDIVSSRYQCSGLCDWLSEYAYFDLKGNLAVCCSKYYITMGNISDYSNFNALWNSLQYKAMRECFFRGEIPSLCQGCRYIVDKTLKNVTLRNYDEDFVKVQGIGTLYEKFSG